MKIRILGTLGDLWGLVADDQTVKSQLVLITNVPITSISVVQEVYNDWRLHTYIEHRHRFDQEQGLDVEDMRVHTLERMRRLFVMVLLSTQIVFIISANGHLTGVVSVITTCITLPFAFLHPFPFQEFTYR